MYTRYKDIETDEIFTREELEALWEDLFSAGETEAETAGVYIANCMYWNNGTLEPYIMEV